MAESHVELQTTHRACRRGNGIVDGVFSCGTLRPTTFNVAPRRRASVQAAAAALNQDISLSCCHCSARLEAHR